MQDLGNSGKMPDATTWLGMTATALKGLGKAAGSFPESAASVGNLHASQKMPA